MKIEDIADIPGAKIQVAIKEDTPQGQYNDCLYYTLDEWADLSEKDVADHKKARVDNWVSFVVEASSRLAVEPTKEELQEQKAELVKRIEQLDTAIAVAISAVPKEEPLEDIG